MEGTKRMKKSIFAVIAAFLMSFTLFAAGCDGGVFGGGVGDDDLVIWANSTYWGGANELLVQQMMDKYEQATGKEVYFVPQSDLDTKLKSVANGAESPDVVIWDRWETVRYINEDRFVCIDDYMQESGVNAADYQSEAMEEMMLDGKHYGIPLDIDVWGLWVNVTALNAAGIEKLPTTWDELRTAANALTVYSDPVNKTGMTRAGMNMKMAGSFYPFLMTAGGQILSDDETKLTVDNDYGRAVLKYFWQLNNEDKVFNEALATGGGPNDPFLTQKIAIQVNSLLNGTNFYDQYSDGTFEYEFIPFPKGPSAELAPEGVTPNSQLGGLMGGFGLAIPTTSIKQDAAWDLINWWVCTTENAVEWSKISGLIPAKLEIINDESMKEVPNVRNAIEVLPYLKARPKTLGYTSIETSVIMSKVDGLLFSNAYRGETADDKIAACLKDMEKAGNEILEFYRE